MRKNEKFVKKSKSIFWIFDPFFRKFDQKTLKSEKKSNLRKSDFWCQKCASRAKITNGLCFLAKNQRKKHFLIIFENCSDFVYIIRQNRDWLRGLPLKTVPTLHKRTWQCRSIKFLSEPERLGQVSIGGITKKSFVASFWLFLSKSHVWPYN